MIELADDEAEPQFIDEQARRSGPYIADDEDDDAFEPRRPSQKEIDDWFKRFEQ